MQCAACGKGVAVQDRVGRRDVCPGCGEDLHSCRNCRFHDAAYENECRESQAERVVDKARSNFCDWFSPADASAAGAPSTDAGARDALERLFRKG